MTVSDYLLPVNLYNHLSEKLSPSSLLITFAVFIDRNMLTFQKKRDRIYFGKTLHSETLG